MLACVVCHGFSPHKHEHAAACLLPGRGCALVGIPGVCLLVFSHSLLMRFSGSWHHSSNFFSSLQFLLFLAACRWKTIGLGLGWRPRMCASLRRAGCEAPPCTTMRTCKAFFSTRSSSAATAAPANGAAATAVSPKPIASCKRHQGHRDMLSCLTRCMPACSCVCQPPCRCRAQQCAQQCARASTWAIGMHSAISSVSALMTGRAPCGPASGQWVVHAWVRIPVGASTRAHASGCTRARACQWVRMHGTICCTRSEFWLEFRTQPHPGRCACTGSPAARFRLPACSCLCYAVRDSTPARPYAAGRAGQGVPAQAELEACMAPSAGACVPPALLERMQLAARCWQRAIGVRRRANRCTND